MENAPAHGAVIAESAAMPRVLRMVEKMIAPTQATTLMTGETGVGKELIARSLHAHRLHVRRSFVAVNSHASSRPAPTRPPEGPPAASLDPWSTTGLSAPRFAASGG